MATDYYGTQILQTTTTNASSAAQTPSSESNSPNWSFMATVTGTGAVTATATIEVAHSASGPWITLGVMTLSGTTSASDGFTAQAKWPFVRCTSSNVTGTGATLVVTRAC